MAEWIVEPVPALRGCMVEWAEPGRFLVSRVNKLYATPDLRRPFQHLATFPASKLRAAAAHVGLAQRLLRYYYYNVLKLGDGSFFVAFHKNLAILRPGGTGDGSAGGAAGPLHGKTGDTPERSASRSMSGAAEPLARFTPLAGLRRPAKILRGGCALADDGCVYFGEYVLNDARDCDISLYRYRPGAAAVEVLRTFPPGFTRHVHGIYQDPGDRSLWCLCGDVKDESHILRSSDGFKTYDTIGKGDETWRGVSVQFRGGAAYYATDAEFQQNKLFRIERASGRRDELADVDGPVFYSTAAGDDLFFAVSAELCPSQQGRSATLWRVDARDHVTRVCAFEKDSLPILLFNRGTLNFPRGPGSSAGEFYFTVHGARGADGHTFRAVKR